MIQKSKCFYYLLFNSLGQTPVFQKDLRRKSYYDIIYLGIIDFGRYIEWIRNLHIMNNPLETIH